MSHHSRGMHCLRVCLATETKSIPDENPEGCIFYNYFRREEARHDFDMYVLSCYNSSGLFIDLALSIRYFYFAFVIVCNDLAQSTVLPEFCKF